MSKTDEKVTVLAVDDDIVSHMLVERALREIESDMKVVAAQDGVEALASLRHEGPVADVRPPFVILLDLRMPQMDGLEFLDAIRNDPALHDAIVFVLSTSRQEEDVKSAFRFHVAGYFVKTTEYSRFKEMMKVVDQYCRLTVFPPKDGRTRPATTAADLSA